MHFPYSSSTFYFRLKLNEKSVLYKIDVLSSSFCYSILHSKLKLNFNDKAIIIIIFFILCSLFLVSIFILGKNKKKKKTKK